MELNLLHFSHPEWLFGLIFIPIAWFILKPAFASHKLEAFIDRHLLPFLLVGKEKEKNSRWKNLALWSLVWTCLLLALSGPRFSFKEVDVLAPGQNLVIALDLSESMNADDVKPSRLKLAKLKIEDLINSHEAVKIGLIAFAKDPHMISPLTEDKETIRSYLPSISTDLVHVQGSRLTETLAMAENMLQSEAGSHKAILLITDGGFEDSISESGIKIHVIGMGTQEGSLLKDPKGNVLKKAGTPVLSKLEKEKLVEITKLSQGRYFDSYQDVDILEKATAETVDKKTRVWDEHFYLFLFPVLPFFLIWFRRGYITYGLLMLLIPSSDLKAFSEHFKNSNERAKDAFDAGDYGTACSLFDDCYQKGVCYYKLGDFENAELMFKQTSDAYNLGNSLAKQMTKEKLTEALAAYDEVLDKDPEHTRAKENREIVKKLLEEQEQQDKQDNQDQDKQDQDKQDEQDSQDKKEDQQKEDPKDQQDRQDKQDRQEKDCKDQDADLWLDRIQNDPKAFLKNKFQIESMKNGTKEAVDPW